MKYEDLIQFDPIESVVQLRHADAASEAARLVSSYVISEQMEDTLTELIIPQLQFEKSYDPKGMLIVGNYGTGKSHLMSVISAVAERGDLAASLTNPKVAKAASAIAGKFKVIRTELATEMDFSDFICSYLEESLAGWGVAYSFPPKDQIKNWKSCFEDMMKKFDDKYPHHGLLLVVDELLDYLRGRDGQAVVRDLNFLRVIGEVCSSLNFRFMAGIQQALFDNPVFSFVSDSVRRVQERFVQVLIARNDIRYVVSHRLLRKNAEQQSLIREHLTKFAPFFDGMTERMDEFVSLFPIHPEFIATFEELKVIEKREILKSLSFAMKRRLKDDVPEDAPGLISYDTYWKSITENPSFRSIPDVRQVLECSQTLEGKIETNFTQKHYKGMAKQLIHALSIQRLASGDIFTPIGVKAEALRDGLCLYDPAVAELGGEPSEDLLATVQTVLREIVKTVNSQFISVNAENGQYYLDLKKTDDYDAYIDRRAESLSKDQLDRYYYEALKRVMECTDQTYVTGFRIWQHELEWRERKACKLGYLFFGAPNQRSTAVPSRDFYLFFIPPFDPPNYKDGKVSDEVFFKLTGMDADFETSLRKFAAATEQASTASGSTKSVYESKANGFIKDVNRWLRENMAKAFEVTYQGKTKSLMDWLKGQTIGQMANMATRDLINLIGSVCLAQSFEEQAPDHPAFSVLITSSNISQAAQDALRWMRGGTKSQQAVAVLDALGLLDGDRVAPMKSKYAMTILNKLQAKGHGQVVNRNEIIEDDEGVEYMDKDGARLEPQWVAVLLGALVYNGEIVISIPGDKLDAGKMDKLVTTPVEELIHFKHIEQPKDWNEPALRRLFEILGEGAGNVQLIKDGKSEPIQTLTIRVQQTVDKLVTVRHQMENPPSLFGKPLLSESELSAIKTKLDDAKTFFESVQGYKNPGQLKNFKHGVPEVEVQEQNLKALDAVATLQSLATDLGPVSTYLAHAETILPAEHSWIGNLQTTRAVIIEKLAKPAERNSATFRTQTAKQLGDLKREYIKAYIDLHTKARLGVSGDKKKAALLSDPRLQQLKKLVTIETLSSSQLADLQHRLADIRSCWSLTEDELKDSPVCPHCAFLPASEQFVESADARLAKLDDELDDLVTAWTKRLLSDLEDPTAAQNRKLLQKEAQKLVSDFLAAKTLPDDITAAFLAATRDALAGLKGIELSVTDLAAALGNAPATVQDVKDRFDAFLATLTKGTDASKVRIIIRP